MTRRPAHSLRQKLIGPFLAAAGLVSLVAVWDIRGEYTSRLEWAISQRAELLASMLNYSAEAITRPRDLQRIVAAAGAEPDVVDIVVVAGTPARVVGSTKAARFGRPLAEVDDPELIRDLQGALARGEAQHHFNDDTVTYDLSAPLLLGQPVANNGSMGQGAVLVRMDTRPIRAVILQSMVRVTVGAVAGILVVAVLGYVVIRRVVLRPVAAIGAAVRRHDERDDQAWAPALVDDELGALARTLRESFLARSRTEAALRLSERMASIGALASGVAHEINTPVQFASDSAHFLREATGESLDLLDAVLALRHAAAAGAAEDELGRGLARLAPKIDAADIPYLLEHVPRAFDRLDEGLGRVAQIVRSLKESSDPQEGEMAPADLNRAIRNALTLARNEYKYVAEIQTDLHELPPVVFRVSDVHQVVLHLIVHAAHAIGDLVKGSPRKGVITVRTNRDGDSVMLMVRHSGAPPPGTIEVADGVDPAAGAAHGLALAERIVTVGHGGTFQVMPVEGATAFVVRLPIGGPVGAATQAAA